MLAYWKGKFYLEYLSNPEHEHIAPGQTFIMSSEDGVNWSKPRVAFPVYPIPAGTYESGDWKCQPDGAWELEGQRSVELPAGITAVMHQRMGFRVAEREAGGLCAKSWRMASSAPSSS